MNQQTPQKQINKGQNQIYPQFTSEADELVSPKNNTNTSKKLFFETDKSKQEKVGRVVPYYQQQQQQHTQNQDGSMNQLGRVSQEENQFSQNEQVNRRGKSGVQGKEKVKSKQKEKGQQTVIEQALQQQEEQFQQDQTLEDGRMSKFYFNRLMNFEYTLLFFALSSIGFSIIYYDNDFKTFDINRIYVNPVATDATLWVIFFISLIQIFITYYRYQALLDLMKKQGVASNRDSLESTNLIRSMCIEIFLILIQPYPFLNNIQFQGYNYYDQGYYDLKLNWIMALLSFIKLFIIIRVLLKKTIFMNPRASRLCRMYGCDPDYQYAIKCLFQDYPLRLIAIVYFLSVVIFAFALRICERPLLISGFDGMDFESIENSIWCVWITMTTVGYGDFYPRTLYGRLLTILISIWGIFIVSMMVVVLSNFLSLDISEKRALIVLNRLEIRKELEIKAAFLLSGYAKQKNLLKKIKTQPPLDTLKDSFLKIKKYADEFKIINRKIKNMFNDGDVYEDMTRQFEQVKEELKNIGENQSKLCHYLEENFDLNFNLNF